MRILNFYIAREMLKGTVIVLIFLLALVTAITFADELDDLGDGAYGLWQIVQYLALTAPRNFVDLIPAAALLGALVVLGSMANQHELTAMRAAGISRWQIIRAVMGVGAVLAVITLATSEFIAPVTEQSAQMLKATARNSQVALKTKYGFWARDGQTFINIRQIQSSGELEDIYIYEMDDQHRLQVASHAERAEFGTTGWQLENIRQSFISSDQVEVKTFQTAQWDSLLDPELLDVVVVKPDRLSIRGLFKYIEFLTDNGQDARPYELALSSKLVRPFVALAMLLVAIPFVLGLQRTSSLGSRILIGAILGIGFTLVERLFGNIGLVYGLNPVVAATLPFFLVLTGSLWAIRRMH